MTLMKKIAIKYKILLIFVIPAFALIYFSSWFVVKKLDELNESAVHMLAAEITESLSTLVHNLQIERGLSAGYIVADNKSLYIKSLQKQFIKTDQSYKNFLTFVHMKTDEKIKLENLLKYKNKPIVKDVIQKLHNKESIRSKVLDSDINFEDEISYYTDINSQLLRAMNTFTLLLSKQNDDGISLLKLQELKEMAGLQRAYIYNQLLSNEFNQEYVEKIRFFNVKQEIAQKNFVVVASIESIIVFTEGINKDIVNQIEAFKKSFFKNRLNSQYASKWFEISSKYIDDIENISNKILNSYIEKSKLIYTNALNALYITALLWILSLFALAVLSYILRVLLKNEEEYTKDLRIAAYTFDSHEAMTITDVNGIIIRVNKAFSRITGYDASEVIGQNPRVLKSMKHSDEFYKDMWHKLHTVGRWSDEIYNRRKNGEIYLERLSITAIKDENDITTHYIAQFLDISDLKKAQERAEHQADHDFLTGLLNRKALMHRLQEEFVKARRHDFLHGYLFIDLDEFKNVNDNFGHAVGDKLLVEVAKRMKKSLREEDILARMSGDEFAIIILNIDRDEPDAAKCVTKICTELIEQMSEVFILDEYKIKISASIGIKLFPDNEKSIQDVVIHADAAMYQAKQQGKNRFIFFDKAIELQLKQFILLEEELNQAYNNSEFVFYFQPKVKVKTGEITGAEMLIRWEHPIKGILEPKEFLDVASEIGLIPKITKLALERACEFLQTHREFKGTLAVNLSSNELIDSKHEEEIIKILNSYDIDLSRIELEITESELIEDFDIAIEKIKKLQTYGVRFSIDDFGTGYSSITYLQKLPINTLKIDKNFMINISQDSDRALVKLIINMAKTFNMNVVVEGIEYESQLNIIKELGAGYYQGFYFSKAVNEEHFIKLLK
jgi:diguanylate cyclase (GGDEF)-like protein/PAS domain S-box-containing protein